MGPLPGVAEVEPDLTLHRPWIAKDPVEFIAAHGSHIQGIATSSATEIGAELLERLPRLEIIACFGVGYDRIDLDTVRRRGIVLTNAGSILTEEVADLALGLLLATLRRIPQADRFVRAGHWRQGGFPLSPSLRGRRVGIIGLGKIGRALARRLEASQVPVAYHDRRLQPDSALPFFPGLCGLAEAVDTLILTAPGGEETRHMVDKAVLDALGPSGVVVNIARGSLIDEAALCAALDENRILGAGLDVLAEEPHVPESLRRHENVVILPHVGSATHDTRNAMGRHMIANLRSWFAGTGALTPVPLIAGEPAR